MNELFLKAINLSISAGWIVLAVLVFRALFKRAPKWCCVLLWGIVAVRLLLPFSFESVLSLIPSKETVPLDIEMSRSPEIHSGVSFVNSIVNPVVESAFTPEPAASANPLQIWVAIGWNLWIVGIAAMLIYAIVSYITLKIKLATAIPEEKGIYRSDRIESPFVLGIVKPKIYLPFTLENGKLECVIAHEKAHIRRGDHLWKPIGYLILSFYFFNPLMWVAYILLCKDIELACDEKVIRELKAEERADYTEALLSCSVKNRLVSACPLAFGEVGVKERVKSVMNYKKPALWLIIAAIVISTAFAVCFLTDPKEPDEDVLFSTPETPQSWPPLEETKEGYTKDEAAKDGCVVFYGSLLYAGGDVWETFVDKTERGESAIVRVYKDYEKTGGGYFVYELRYNGDKFYLQVHDREGDTGREFLKRRSFKYLKYSYMKSSTKDGRDSRCWLLCDNKDVTAEGYFGMLLSSTLRPEHSIYNNCAIIYQESLDINSYAGKNEEVNTVDTPPVTTEPANDPSDIAWAPEDMKGPLCLSFNGEYVKPYVHFRYSETYSEYGWLAGDGLSLLMLLEKGEADIPEVRYDPDVTVTVNTDVLYRGVTVYTKDLARLHYNANNSVLSELASGEYYIAYSVTVMGDFVSSENKYNTTGYDLVYKLIVD